MTPSQMCDFVWQAKFINMFRFKVNFTQSIIGKLSDKLISIPRMLNATTLSAFDVNMQSIRLMLEACVKSLTNNNRLIIIAPLSIMSNIRASIQAIGNKISH